MDDIGAAEAVAIDIDGPLLSAAEIAELFSVHPSTIRRLAREGRVPSYSVGSAPRFVAEEVAACFRTETTSPPRPLRIPAQIADRGQPARPLDRARLRTELFGN